MQLRSLFQIRLQYMLSVSKDAFEESVLSTSSAINDVVGRIVGGIVPKLHAPSTAILPRNEFSTTYVTTVTLVVCGLLQ